MGIEEKVKWSERENKNADPLEFFKEHYIAGTTRGKLRIADIGLYQCIRRRGLLEQIPMANRRYGGDEIGYYMENYAGLTRGQVNIRDHGFYETIRSKGLLKLIPKWQGNREHKPHRVITDPLAYYYDNYPGLTRGKLEKADQVLYHRLLKDGLIAQVPQAHK
jgi:hypothetical protein